MYDIEVEPTNRHVERVTLDERSKDVFIQLKERSSYSLLMHRLDLFCTVAGLDGTEERAFEYQGHEDQLTVFFTGNTVQAMNYLHLDRFISQQTLSAFLERVNADRHAAALTTRHPAALTAGPRK